MTVPTDSVPTDSVPTDPVPTDSVSTGPVPTDPVRAGSLIGESRPGVPPAAAVPLAGRHAAKLNELGMATAEYAVATLAATGFAGLLLVLLRSGEVRGLLRGIIERALGAY
ncbi:MAG: DUF4244 domain-containing protein [Kineosporiaceae bacterium]|jgi:hypothetical protein